MRYQSYGPGLKNLDADRRAGGDNVHVVVDQPSSVKARQVKFSSKDILKFIFT